VRKRWEQGDPEIVEGMKAFAQFTDEAKIAIAKVLSLHSQGPLCLAQQ